jgi:hypothetical protein
MDDIRGEVPGSETQTAKTQGSGIPDTKAERERRSVGPESETRGAPEAPATHTAPDGMPGDRAGLPEGSLPGPYLETQGDENRTPPPNAPSPVTPAPTVDTPDRG